MASRQIRQISTRHLGHAALVFRALHLHIYSHLFITPSLVLPRLGVTIPRYPRRRRICNHRLTFSPSLLLSATICIPNLVPSTPSLTSFSHPPTSENCTTQVNSSPIHLSPLPSIPTACKSCTSLLRNPLSGFETPYFSSKNPSYVFGSRVRYALLCSVDFGKRQYAAFPVTKLRM